MGKIEDLETINGEGYQLTTLDKAIGLARANSVWPLPFATSCCGIEFMATMGSMYDMSRFGMERMSFTPRQADLLPDCDPRAFRKPGSPDRPDAQRQAVQRHRSATDQPAGRPRNDLRQPEHARRDQRSVEQLRPDSLAADARAG